MLDPGPDDAAHLRSILGGRRPVDSLDRRHPYAPRSFAAGRGARARDGARLIGLPAPADGRQDERFRPDELPRDGERLGARRNCASTAIHTPGHASNCVCYLLQSERLLFTGDHVLGGVSPVILPPDGDMAAYLNSLDKLAGLRFRAHRAGPWRPHGARQDGGSEAARAPDGARGQGAALSVERRRRGDASMS